MRIEAAHDPYLVVSVGTRHQLRLSAAERSVAVVDGDVIRLHEHDRGARMLGEDTKAGIATALIEWPDETAENMPVGIAVRGDGTFVFGGQDPKYEPW